MKKDNRARLLLSISLLAVAAVSVVTHRPPRPVTSDAAPTEFSAERAMTHVKVIASEPHPVGSPKNAQVRDYLFGQLEKMGLEPQIQQATTVRGWRVAEVENVLARLPGTDNSRAILLVAHYDSVPMSHGAGDAASAVAAILETLRALQAGPQLKNDIIVLFTNPEEVFLHGGKAFVDEHAWAKDVGLAINMDPGGVSGPAFMHETSTGNRNLIDVMATVVRHPVATSLAYAVKKIQEDRSDEFHLFTDAGIMGYNVSFFYGDTRYHTRMDRPDQLDPGSVQHLGEYALSLTRHFGNVDTFSASNTDAVYFSIGGARFIHYPVLWAIPFALLCALLFVASVRAGMRTGHLTWPGMGKGIVVYLVAFVAIPLQTMAVWWILRRTTGIYDVDLTGNVYNGAYFLLGFSALSIATFVALYAWFRKRVTPPDLTFGALCWWLLLMVGSAVLLPGGSYVFVWPLLFVLLATGFGFAALDRPELDRLKPAVLVVFAAPVILMIVPQYYTMFSVLSMEDLPLVTTIIVLLLGALLPQLFFAVSQSAQTIVGGSLLVGAAFLVAGVSTPFDTTHPEPDFLLYGKNAATSEAVWATRAQTGREPDAWVSSYFGGPTATKPLEQFYPWSSSMFVQGSAPLADLPEPKTVVVADSLDGEVRVIRLHVLSIRRAPILILVSETPVVSWSVQGRPIDSRQVMVYWNLPPAGIYVDIRVRPEQPGGPIEFVVVDQSYGLPVLPGETTTPRPDDKMPEPSGGLIISDATLVRTTVVLP